MLPTAVLLCLVAWSSGSTPETWFTKEAETFMSTKSWTLLLDIELEPYGIYFERLDSEIKSFKAFIHTELDQSRNMSLDLTTHRNVIIPLLNSKTSEFENEISALKEFFGEIKMGFNDNRGRNKRSLYGRLGRLIAKGRLMTRNACRVIVTVASFSERFASLARNCIINSGMLGDVSIDSGDTSVISGDGTELGTTDTSTEIEVNNRKKRSLLPFLGPVMSLLFGTANAQDIAGLRDNIEHLNSKHNRLALAVHDSLSVINNTRQELYRNRKAINSLALSVRITRDSFMQLTEALEYDLSNEIHFEHFYQNIQSLFQIMTSTLHKFSRNLVVLHYDLQLAFQGTLTQSMIPSIQMKRLLLNIKRNIDKPYQLPFRLNRLEEYYRNLPIVTGISNGKITIAMIIPLKESNIKYDIFRTISLPAVHNKFLHYWDIESRYIAISVDKSTYFYLNERERSLCIHGFCLINKPVFSMLDSCSCLTALYQADKALVKQYCHFISNPLPDSVSVDFLYNNTWLVVTPTTYQLDVVCPTKSQGSDISTISIQNHIFVLDIPENCRITSRYFSLKSRNYMKLASKAHRWNGIQKVNFPMWNNTDSIIEFILPHMRDLVITTLPPLQLNDDKLELLGNMVLETISDLPISEMSPLMIFVLVLTIMSIIMIIAFSTYFLYKRIMRGRKMRVNQPQPIPKSEPDPIIEINVTAHQSSVDPPNLSNNDNDRCLDCETVV